MEVPAYLVVLVLILAALALYRYALTGIGYIIFGAILSGLLVWMAFDVGTSYVRFLAGDWNFSAPRAWTFILDHALLIALIAVALFWRIVYICLF